MHKDGSLLCLCDDVPSIFLWDISCVPQTLRRSGEISTVLFTIDTCYPQDIPHVRHRGLRNG